MSFRRASQDFDGSSSSLYPGVAFDVDIVAPLPPFKQIRVSEPEAKSSGLLALLHAAQVVFDLDAPFSPSSSSSSFPTSSSEEEEEEDDEEGLCQKQRLDAARRRQVVSGLLPPAQQRPSSLDLRGNAYRKQDQAQTKRFTIRRNIEANIDYVRKIYRDQHRVALSRPGPVLACTQSESKYWRLTEQQAQRYDLPGIHGLRKPVQSFAVSWKSVVISQKLLDFGSRGEEDRVESEFPDPRDASQVSQRLKCLFD
ncbi:hypothetical protein BASA81_006694 [Batrachochytrium salamandrivorans]|nr:hypothetical protein BASA81_006694 [Batrachochytrium salamandrivorans]